jgi:hypothetical protein
MPLLALLLCLLCPAAVAGGFSFAAWGDVPYSQVERDRALDMLAEQAAQPLAFSIHIGDIKSGGSACDDATFADRRELLDGSTHPLILLPGDNEWTDCARKSNGEWRPHERLDALRTLFFGTAESLGRMRIALSRQDCCPENARWQHGDVVFVTLNVSGSPPPHGRRSRALESATLRWLKQAFEQARAADAAALVIAFHANPGFEAHARGKPRTRHAALLDELTGRAGEFAKPVLIIHGDTHRQRVDQPLRDPRSGKPLTNVTRLETHGSPWLGWTMVKVDTATPEVFSFEARPQWLQ